MALRLVGGSGESGEDERRDAPQEKHDLLLKIGVLALALHRACCDAGGVSLVQGHRAQEGTGADPLMYPAPMQAAPVVVVVSMDEALARWKDLLSGEDKSVRTISSYSDKLNTCADAAGWRTVGDVSYESAMAFIAGRKRNDHDGIAWENGACRHAISALKSFGKFLAAAGLCPVNPLGNLALPKRRPQRHKHPFTESEARGIVGASLARHGRDKRARGHAPLVWATLFWTGLRHSEVQAPCKANKYGGVKWRDVTLDGEYPGIWTDPRWVGNKGKTRDWLPMHPRLHALLLAHRETVPHRPDDPVFPIWPIRATWVDDRARAKLPDRDEDGRALSVHATRASYITWLGRLALPEGLVSRLARHSMSLAERVYTTRDKAAMAAAVAQLPNIWPDLGGMGPTGFPPDSKNPTHGLASAKPIGYSANVRAASHDSPPVQHVTSGPPGAAHSGLGGGVVLEPSVGPVAAKVDGPPVAYSNPDLSIDRDEDLLRSSLKTLNLLVQRLARTGSDKERGDEQARKEP